jgi:hypothetical protein
MIISKANTELKDIELQDINARYFSPTARTPKIIHSFHPVPTVIITNPDIECKCTFYYNKINCIHNSCIECSGTENLKMLKLCCDVYIHEKCIPVYTQQLTCKKCSKKSLPLNLKSEVNWTMLQSIVKYIMMIIFIAEFCYVINLISKISDINLKVFVMEIIVMFFQFFTLICSFSTFTNNARDIEKYHYGMTGCFFDTFSFCFDDNIKYGNKIKNIIKENISLRQIKLSFCFVSNTLFIIMYWLNVNTSLIYFTHIITFMSFYFISVCAFTMRVLYSVFHTKNNCASFFL